METENCLSASLPCCPETMGINAVYYLPSDLPAQVLFCFVFSLPSFPFSCRLTMALWTWFYLLLFPQSLLHQLFLLFLKSSVTLSLHWLLLPPATNILRYPSSLEKTYPTKTSVSPSTIILFKLPLKGMLLFLDLHLTHQHNLILLPALPPPHPFPWTLLWERSTMISS